jgi:predicted ATPase
VEGDDPIAQMDAQSRKRRTLEAIKRILLRESLNQPLMVVFEDLHWIASRPGFNFCSCKILMSLMRDTNPDGPGE